MGRSIPMPTTGAKALQGDAELAGREKNGKDKEKQEHQKGVERGLKTRTRSWCASPEILNEEEVEGVGVAKKVEAC